MDRKTREAILSAVGRGMAYERSLQEKRDQRLWKEVSLPSGLGDVLENLTKGELDDIRKTLDIRGVSSLKKKELAQRLEEEIPARFKSILHRFDQERYTLIQKAAKNSGSIAIPKSISLKNIKSLMSSGIIFPVMNNGEKLLCMPSELVQLFKKIDGEELRQAANRNSEWLTLVNGMLYYYGIMDISQILERVREATGQETELSGLKSFLDVLYGAIEYYGDMAFTSYGLADERVFDAKFIREEQKKRPDIKYYPFTKKQLLAAGKPGFIDKTQQMKDFLQFMREFYNFPPEEGDAIAEELILIMNNEGQLGMAIDFLQTKFEFPSLEFVQVVADLLVEVFNNNSRWVLKGNSPVGLRKSEQPEAVLSAAPAKNALRESNVIDFATRKAAGRNDPCPCGSGKKYKKCCGKG